MATQNSNVNGTAVQAPGTRKVDCQVRTNLAEGYIEVFSPKGGSVKVAICTLRKMDKDVFALCVDETFDGEEYEESVALTVNQMKNLVTMSKIQPGTNGNTKVAPAVKAPVVSAKVEAQQTSQMEKTLEKADRSRSFGATGASGVEGRLISQRKVIDKIKACGGLHVVNYYIPKELSIPDPTNGIRCPNPCKDFYALGVHLDGSNWLMTKEALESEVVQWYFDNWKQYEDFRGSEGRGAEGWDWEPKDSQIEKFLAVAERRFTQRVQQIHKSLIECIMNADEELKRTEEAFQARIRGELAGGPVSSKEETAAIGKRMNKVRARIKIAADDLNDAIAAAEQYDMTENLADLFSGLRKAIRSQQESFNTAAEELKVKLSDVAV